MPRRYSGNVTIRVAYHEGNFATFNQFPNGYYDCALSWPGGMAKERVGVPRSISRAVDSPLAYDDAARAALTFYGDTTRLIPGNFEPDFGDAGAIVSRRK